MRLWTSRRPARRLSRSTKRRCGKACRCGKGEWQAYLDWAVECFRITSSGVGDATQIHTHMCYSEFNDIIASIAAMDADVISIETARSQMELLDVFAGYPLSGGDRPRRL